jgi:glutathione S-transferase
MLAAMIRLFGTHTSPYVRRVRVVAHELGLGVELIDTASEPGQSQLRERSPIWKVPTAEIDGQLVFDSGVICSLLVTRAGSTIAPVEQLDDRNAITVVDGALDSLINTFYLARDGVRPAEAAYVQKQHDRAASALAWIDARIHDGWLSHDRRFGLPEIALGTAVAWMRFRATYPVERHPGVLACLARCEERDSFAATKPPAA